MNHDDNLKLTKLGQQTLSLLETFGMVTPAIIESWTKSTKTQVKNELRRLREDELSESFEFLGRSVYYRLTRAATRRLDVSKRLSGPLGPQALRLRYGLLHFCAQFRPARPPLNHSQLERVWNAYGERSAEIVGNFYVDIQSTKTGPVYRLGHVFVDCGAEPINLVRKVSAFIEKRRSSKAFRELVANGEFLTAFVVESKGKATAVVSAAKTAKLGLPIRTNVCPELEQL